MTILVGAWLWLVLAVGGWLRGWWSPAFVLVLSAAFGAALAWAISHEFRDLVVRSLSQSL